MSGWSCGNGKRAEREAVLKIPASPSRVFPLLCPERERDWIPGWDYRMVYSVSGYAEPGCTFVTDFPPEGLTVWTFLEHVPDRHVVIFRVSPDLVTIRWQMDLTGSGSECTEIRMHWTVTGLSAKGNRYIDEVLDERFTELAARLETQLSRYLCSDRES
jgi:hypothetical protein